MPSGLAIGAGLAQGFEKAAQNFIASMNAVQEMKMRREKFDLDKKISNLQIDKLGIDLDPETHMQMKKMNTMKMSALDTLMKYQEAKIDEIHKKTSGTQRDYINMMRGNALAFENFKKEFPGLADKASLTTKMGDSQFKLGTPKSQEDEMFGFGESDKVKDTTQTDELKDYESMDPEELFKLAESGDEKAQQIGFKLYGGE